MTDADYQPSTKDWTGAEGQRWFSIEALMDGMLAPLKDALISAVAAQPGERVLDVGCGTGATTFALADQAEVLGVDISAEMIGAAQRAAAERGSTARFQAADAAKHAFEPETFDVICSKLGVMFFDDTVEAFTNLATAAAPQARLVLVVFRPAEDNLFMTTAERTAAAFMQEITPRQGAESAPFGFGDQAQVTAWLTASGWKDLAFNAIDPVCRFPQALLRTYVENLGPVANAIADRDAADRAAIVDRLIPAFERFKDGGDIAYPAGCWLITATNA